MLQVSLIDNVSPFCRTLGVGERYTRRMLLCPVRDCHLELVREERRLFCSRGHSFDVARSGYINLLQPQDRRSKQPGDTAAAVAGRRRLHDLGVTAPLLRAITEIANPRPTDVVLDAGCGEGFYLGELARQTGFAAHGIDISIPAVNAAAEAYALVLADGIPFREAYQRVAARYARKD